MLRNESGSKISFCWFPPLFGGDSKHMWLNHRGRRLEYPVVRGLERQVVPSLINFRKPCFLHHNKYTFPPFPLHIFLLSSLSSFSPLYFLGFFSDNKLRVIFRISKISIEAPYQLAYQHNNHQPGKSRNLQASVLAARIEEPCLLEQ